VFSGEPWLREGRLRADVVAGGVDPASECIDEQATAANNFFCHRLVEKMTSHPPALRYGAAGKEWLPANPANKREWSEIRFDFRVNSRDSREAVFCG
jgi:hypothetical protein